MHVTDSHKHLWIDLQLLRTKIPAYIRTVSKECDDSKGCTAGFLFVPPYMAEQSVMYQSSDILMPPAYNGTRTHPPTANLSPELQSKVGSKEDPWTGSWFINFEPAATKSSTEEAGSAVTEAEISEAAADKAAVAAEAQGCLEEQVQQAADEAAAAAIAKARAKSSATSRIITGWQWAAGEPRPVTQERCDAFVKILRGESGHSTTTSYKHDAFSLMYVNVKPRGSDMPAPRDFKPGGRGYDITCICKAYTHSFCCRHSLAVASAIQCTLGKGASVGPLPMNK